MKFSTVWIGTVIVCALCILNAATTTSVVWLMFDLVCVSGVLTFAIMYTFFQFIKQLL